MLEPIILASGSTIRQKMLTDARVPFDVSVARIDEEMLKASLVAENVSPRDIADALAEGKAQKIAAKNPSRMVLGCDQVLEFEGGLISKSASKEAALEQLLRMRGKPHRLFSAAVFYDQSKPVWRHVARVDLHMLQVSEAYLSSYVARNWGELKYTVGNYMLEAEGVRLFHTINGDYFAVLGLPLMQILGYLRTRGVIEA